MRTTYVLAKDSISVFPVQFSVREYYEYGRPFDRGKTIFVSFCKEPFKEDSEDHFAVFEEDVSSAERYANSYSRSNPYTGSIEKPAINKEELIGIKHSLEEALKLAHQHAKNTFDSVQQRVKAKKDYNPDDFAFIDETKRAKESQLATIVVE